MPLVDKAVDANTFAFAEVFERVVRFEGLDLNLKLLSIAGGMRNIVPLWEEKRFNKLERHVPINGQRLRTTFVPDHRALDAHYALGGRPHGTNKELRYFNPRSAGWNRICLKST